MSGPLATGIVAAFVALLLSACSSGPDRRAMIEEARKSVPPMAADEPMFSGKVVAHITLASDMPDFGAAHGEGSGGGHGGGGHWGGGFGGGRGRRGGGGAEAGSSDELDAGSGNGARHLESPMPPALLRLKLENKTDAPITVEVRDFDSELGNFAVQPDHLTIAPGQTAEPNPMVSRLGVDSLALPVTMTLRTGGQTETKILTLRPTNPPPAKGK